MGIAIVFGATPAVESGSLQFKLFNFVEGAQIEVAHSNWGIKVFDGFDR
jgi:hypothetical protein